MNIGVRIGRNIGDDAVRRGKLASNPVRLAAGPKFRRDHPRRHMAWHAHELTAFLTHTRAHVHHRSFWLAAHTGMRRGELLGLRWHGRRPDPATPALASRPQR